MIASSPTTKGESTVGGALPVDDQPAGIVERRPILEARFRPRTTDGSGSVATISE